jgi:hypothetical protein
MAEPLARFPVRLQEPARCLPPLPPRGPRELGGVQVVPVACEPLPAAHDPDAAGDAVGRLGTQPVLKDLQAPGLIKTTPVRCGSRPAPA